tara:strand:+ start:2863 stop:3465 length:603 start_codon:yes stop_codon:yes gene_type:complete
MDWCFNNFFRWSYFNEQKLKKNNIMDKQLLKIPFILFAIILLIFFYLLIIDRNPSKIPSALLNSQVPEFETDSLFKNEKFYSSEEFSKEITLVNFFATWCKPCRDEHAYIQKFSNEKKIKIIGINYKDSPKKAIQWLKKLGNPYSNVAVDKNGKIAIDWGVYGIPETFVVDAKGIIKFRHVGPVTKNIYKKIYKLIESLD